MMIRPLPAVTALPPPLRQLVDFASLGEALWADITAWLNGADMTALGAKVLIALVIGIAVHVVLAFTLRVVASRLTALGDQETPAKAAMAFGASVGRLLRRTSGLFIVVVSITIASYVLPLNPPVRGAIDSAFVIAFVLQVALWASVALAEMLTHYTQKSTVDQRSLTTATALIGTVARIALWSIALLLILDNLGFNITALVAGLGIGGIAVGLAAQNILGDLFASLAIVLDKPFELGDFIITGNNKGTVERIGLKTTRLRSLSGEQLVISNNDLLASRIQNYKRMAERRIIFTIGVVYGTPADKLEQVPKIIQEIISQQKLTRFDRSHFAAYGDSSLDFETVYYVLSAEYNVFMDIQQAINFALYRRFEELGLSFAFPTRTIHVEGLGDRAAALSADGQAAAPAPGSAP